MSSGPERQVPSVLPRAGDLLVQLDQSGLDGSGDCLRHYGAFAFRQVEPPAQRLVGHSLRDDPLQSAVLVGSADAVLPIHFVEISWTVDRNESSPVASPKIGCGQLVHLRCLNHTVNTAALLLANAHPPHQSREAFIAGLVAVDESFHRHHRLARVRDLDAVAIDFHHHGGSAHRELLVDQGVGNQLADNNLWNEFHLLAERVLDNLVLRQLGHDKAEQPLKTNRIALHSGLVEPGNERSSQEIASELGVSQPGVALALGRMAKKGKAHKSGDGKYRAATVKIEEMPKVG